MKKFISIILIAALTMAALVGCAAEPTDSTEPAAQTAQSPEQQTEQTTEEQPTADQPEAEETETVETEAETEEGEEETEEETEADEFILYLDDIVGVWHIEDDDLAALSETFPGAAEFGSGMEIRSDGNISWYIGADGGVGAYTISGDTLTAQVTAEADGADMTVTLTYTEFGDFEMTFRDTTIVWVYGDGGSLRGDE